MTVTRITTMGALLADRTRATVLLALMDGRARTAGELAKHARVAASTMSEHLARMADAGVITMVAQGRHRYARISDAEIGSLLESLGRLELPDGGSYELSVRAPDELRTARTCYDHLAGRVAVLIHDRMLERDQLVEDAAGLRITAAGDEFLASLGVRPQDIAGIDRRPAIRPCLDWTERRDHLAGPVAAAMLTALLDSRCLVRGSRPRSVRVTEKGHRLLEDTFGFAEPELVGA